MKNSELKVNYLDENTFWHITSKLNIESIKRNGLVPRDGKRNGKSTSAEDPVPRVFFSQGLEGVLGQANNLAFLMNAFIKNIEKTNDGDRGENVKEKMQEFLNNSVNNEIEKKEDINGGFIDIANFIKKDIFKKGINKNLNEQDLNKIIYNITKTIWENDVCLKANLEENVDYSWNDTNYSVTGNKKRPMTKKNMHAFEGHTITSDKIEMITDETSESKEYWQGVFGDLEGKDIEQHKLVNLAKQHDKKTKFFAWCGLEDFLFDSQDKAVADLKALGLDINYRTDHGRHEWYYWEKQLEAYLEWLPIDYVKEERLS